MDRGPEGRLEAARRRRPQLPGRRRRGRVRLLPAEGEERRRPGRVRRRDRREEVGEELRPGGVQARRSATARGARPASPAARCSPSAAPASSPAGTRRPASIAWKVDTLKEFKAPNLFFGISTSPLVEGEDGRRHGRREGGRRRRVRRGDRQDRLEGDRRPGQLRLPDRHRERGGPAARLPHRGEPARPLPGRRGPVGVPVQGPAEQSLHHPGEGRRPDRRQLGDGRQRRAEDRRRRTASRRPSRCGRRRS